MSNFVNNAGGGGFPGMTGEPDQGNHC